jgi:hypothetical protein
LESSSDQFFPLTFDLAAYAISDLRHLIDLMWRAEMVARDAKAHAKTAGTGETLIASHRKPSR